jgi:hypothetical protein
VPVTSSQSQVEVTSTAVETLFADLLSLEEVKSSGLPPVHLWNPPLSGTMDLIIDREGRWIHEGNPILREAIVRLFSSILKTEDRQFFLVSPVEKWLIEVEVAPFYITSVSRDIRGSDQAISCETSTGENIVIGSNHPLTLAEQQKTGEILPLAEIRQGLKGFFSRSTYYQLVEWSHIDGAENDQQLFITSMGQRFSLGSLAE